MEKPLMVIKYGSASVTDEYGMDVYRLSRYAAQIAVLAERFGMVIVSSGSVAVGRGLWRQRSGSAPYPDAQTLAMLGSAESAVVWQRALRTQNLLASQLLVTHREINEASAKGSLLKALRANLAQGVIPIVNENDAVSEQELAKLAYGGDNDGLGAHVAKALGAQKLLLLTEAPGVLDGQELVSKVPFEISAHSWLKTLARGSNGKGRGGMGSKIEAAISAAQSGVETFIAAADASIEDTLTQKTGTYFVPNPKQVV